MLSPETKLFCRLDGLTPAAREQQRLSAMADLGLLEAETVPVFEEATQTAARFLETPICILGLMTQERQLLKSAVGLSRVGLMNELATSRQLSRSQSFCTYVVDSHQSLLISDTLSNPVFASSLLVQQYGIRSYLGAPLLTASGQCVGTIAVMDLQPHSFTCKDIEFLELMARWSLSEFERMRLLKFEQKAPMYALAKSAAHEQSEQGWEYGTVKGNSDLSNIAADVVAKPFLPNPIKLQLLTQLSQELRTPLTSVMGMASVLNREVYGPLTTKQKEYLEIIHTSGQHLVSLVDEILALGVLDEHSQRLNPSSVDMEMLCQQAIKSLEKFAKIREQQIRLSIEPGNRIWLLDKEKVRQILYYLVFNIIHSAEAGGIIRIHVSRKTEKLNIAIWVSHPWLGDGLPQVEFYSNSAVSLLPTSTETILSSHLLENKESSLSTLRSVNQSYPGSHVPGSLAVLDGHAQQVLPQNNSREILGLLLSSQLAELHGGQITVQGSPEIGCRYVVSLPQLAMTDEKV